MFCCSASRPCTTRKWSAREGEADKILNIFLQNLLLFSFNEELQEDGDYRLCLDNSRSRWSDKTVWFEVQVEDPADDYDDDYMEDEEWEKIKAVGDDTEKLFDMTVEEIQNTVHSVRIRVNKIRHGSYLQGAHMSKVKYWWRGGWRIHFRCYLGYKPSVGQP